MNGEPKKERISLIRKVDLFAIGALIGWFVVVFFLWGAIAHGQTAASQPASQPVFDPSNLNGLAAWAWYAVQHKQWAYLLFGAIIVLLKYERSWKGVLGEKSTQWLGSPLGVAITSAVLAIATAGFGVANSGWKSIGSACAMAGIVAGINVVAQLPFEKKSPVTPPPVEADAANPAADAAAKPADPEKKD